MHKESGMEMGILEISPQSGKDMGGRAPVPAPGEGSLPRREGGENEDGAAGRVAGPPECPFLLPQPCGCTTHSKGASQVGLRSFKKADYPG